MPNFKFVISDKQKSWQIEKDQKECPTIDKKIGETAAITLKITPIPLKVKKNFTN